ncbi:LysR family transcriptional regulator [Halocynthiibacter styelae]|uniref:LysR family transcriptional regulator n=1 Tax=Halocynthiibacter styelae TaxID=2761955 RepID=A0A8J7IMU5_9RHOB|nr:LysR family transcriptional regulator [Paenihalocynthiibacter styelae]MBI1493606.1 LysR family transcriptional regulator [Paenihalocynthiibacter styelae]
MKVIIDAHLLIINNQAMLNWNDLRYVLETARRGGISGAARVLKVNHGTVSRRITAAEEALGARLFDRLASGYVLTEAGREAILIAENMEAQGHQLERQMDARDTRIAGPLTVTAPQMMVDRVLGPVLKSFITTYPDVDLKLRAGNDALNLAARQADVALRVSPDPPDSLIGRRVAEQRYGIYAAPDLIAADRGGRLDWISFQSWPGPPKEFLALRPDLTTRLVVDDIHAALSAARAGIGATRLACIIGDDEPGLERLPDVPLFPYMPVWLLTHADLRNQPRVRAIMDHVGAAIKTARPRFLGET